MTNYSASEKAVQELEGTQKLGEIESQLRAIFKDATFLDVLARNKVNFKIILEFTSEFIDTDPTQSFSEAVEPKISVETQSSATRSIDGLDIVIQTPCKLKGGKKNC